MNFDVDELIEKVINGINSNWTTNEKIRYVYIEVGKKLAKDITFFYSLGNKINEESLSIDELKKRYKNDKIVNNKVICKSAAMILKKIYDKIGVQCKLMQSSDYQVIGNEQESFELYHWFLCCNGDNNKKYFLTLIPDLMNIQNGWQTEHFATSISYYRSEEDEKSGKGSYFGERIYEEIMDSTELEQLDMRIGYLKPKNCDIKVPEKGKLDIEDFIYYENGRKKSGITQQQSPFIYENIIDHVSSKKGYTNILAEETDFYNEAFEFKNKDGIIINFLEMPLISISEEDIRYWVELLQRKTIDNSDLAEDIKEKMLYQIERIGNKLIENKRAILEIKNNKKLLSNLEKNQNNEEEYYHLVDNIKSMEKKALKNIQHARSLLHEVSRNFLSQKYLPQKNHSTEYIIKRFETIIPTLLMLNHQEKPMTSRCNGLGEQLALIDRVLKDVFDGNIVSKEPGKERIVRTAIYNSETEEYDLIFQIDKKYFYFLDPRTGEFIIVRDIVGFLSNNNYTVLNDQVNDRIAEIEKEMENKLK